MSIQGLLKAEWLKLRETSLEKCQSLVWSDQKNFHPQELDLYLQYCYSSDGSVIVSLFLTAEKNRKWQNKLRQQEQLKK